MRKLLGLLLLVATIPLLLPSSPPPQQVLTATGGVVQASIDQNGWRSFQLTLTQAVTFQFIGFPTPAQGNVVVFFTENNVGGFSVTFQNWTSPSGTVISISNPCAVTTTANATTVCSFNFNGTTNTWVGVASGGVPGGTTGQVQYNNGGAFAGVDASNFSINGSGILLAETLGKASVVAGNGLTIINTGAGGTLNAGGSNQATWKIGAASAHSLAPIEQGTCTMSSGTCTVTWGTAFANTPNCQGLWNGTGALTGFLKGVPSATNCVFTSSVGTDTAVIQAIGVGNPN